MISNTLAVELWLTSPMLALSVGALLVMVLESFVPKSRLTAHLTGISLALALIFVFLNGELYQGGGQVFSRTLFVDPYAGFVTLLIVLGALLSHMLGASKIESEGVESPSEYYALFLIATAGAIVFSTAGELITLFLGLETMSMALYCLCGAAVHDRRSTESALKYFLLGSFSSAFLLFGIALIYGASGTTFIASLPDALEGANRFLLLVGLGLMLVGFVFKIGAVPFHFWAPDVYEGAPTAVTVFMASVIKAASVGVAIRVLWSVFDGSIVFWSGAIWYLALFTMIVGNIVAVQQRSVKRMLAYSSIAHAGYMMVGFLAPDDMFGGGAAILFYLMTYSMMTIGAFAVVMTVTDKFVKDRYPDDITRFNGLGWREPMLGALLSLFMLSLAGLPPGMAGLLGKVYLFSAAIKSGHVLLTVVGVLCSAISCYYYLRVIVAMYFVEGDEKGEAGTLPVSLSTGFVLGFCAVAVIGLGVFPSTLYDAASDVVRISQLIP